MARTAAGVFDNQSFADEEIHSVFSDSEGKFFRYECLKNVKREGIPESVESGCSGLVFRKCIFSGDYSKWLNDLHNSVKFSYVDQKIDNLNVGDDNKEKLKTFKKKFASGYISDAINSRRSVPDKLQRSMGKIQGSLQVGGSGSSARSQQEQIGSSEVGRADSDYHATVTDLRPQDPRGNDYIGDSAENLDQAGMSFYGPLDVPAISPLSDGPELPDASDIERRCLQIKMYLESIRHNVGFIINPPRPGPNHREHLLSGGKQFAYDVPLANYHVLKLQPTKEEFTAELAKWKLYKDENLLFSEYDKVKPVLGGKRRSSEKYSVKFKELQESYISELNKITRELPEDFPFILADFDVLRNLRVDGVTGEGDIYTTMALELGPTKRVIIADITSHITGNTENNNNIYQIRTWSLPINMTDLTTIRKSLQIFSPAIKLDGSLYEITLDESILMAIEGDTNNMKIILKQIGDLTDSSNSTGSSGYSDSSGSVMRREFINWVSAPRRGFRTYGESLDTYIEGDFRQARNDYHTRRYRSAYHSQRDIDRAVEADINTLRSSLLYKFKLDPIKLKDFIMARRHVDFTNGNLPASLRRDLVEKYDKYLDIINITTKLSHYLDEIGRLKTQYMSMNNEYQVAIRNEQPDNHVNCWDGQFNSLVAKVCGPKAAIFWYGDSLRVNGEKLYPGNFDLGRLKKNVNGLGTVSKELIQEYDRDGRGKIFFPFSNEINVKPLDKRWANLDTTEKRVASDLGWTEISWDGDFGTKVSLDPTAGQTGVDPHRRDLMNYLGMDYYGIGYALASPPLGTATINDVMTDTEIDFTLRLIHHGPIDNNGELINLIDATDLGNHTAMTRDNVFTEDNCAVSVLWLGRDNLKNHAGTLRPDFKLAKVRLRSKSGPGEAIEGYILFSKLTYQPPQNSKHFDAAPTASSDHHHAMWELYRLEVIPLFALLPENKSETQVIKYPERPAGMNYKITQIQSQDNILSGTHSLIGSELWKRPKDNNGNNIDPCLIKLLGVKKKIIAKQQDYYQAKERLEKNIDILKNNSDSKGKGKDKDKDQATDQSTGQATDQSTDQATGQATGQAFQGDKSILDAVKESIKDISQVTDGKVSITDPALPNKTYTSDEINKLQRDLDQLKLEIETKAGVLENIKADLQRSKRLSHGIESEERQKQIVDYELKEKELSLLRAFVLSRDEKIKILKILASKIDDRDTMLKTEKEKREKKLMENNLSAMRTKMSEVSQKHIDDENMSFRKIKDSEIDGMLSKVRGLDGDENRNRIGLDRVKTNNRDLDNLDNLLFKGSKDGSRPKVKTAKKNQKDRRSKSKNKYVKSK